MFARWDLLYVYACVSVFLLQAMVLFGICVSVTF